jgi:hypothetical protein
LMGNTRTRRNTIYFLLSLIGIFDILLLLAQVQRWLAIHIDPVYINTVTFCKVYYLLLRVSLMSASSLFLAILVIQFIKYNNGRHQLDIRTNLGQMCSRLCAIYITTMTVSASGFSVWTAGIQVELKPGTCRFASLLWFRIERGRTVFS